MPLLDKHLRILWPLFPLLIAIGFWFGVKAGGDNLLRNSNGAPSGIGSLERAGSVGRAQMVMQSWKGRVPDRRTEREIKSPSILSVILTNDGLVLTDVAKRSLIFDLFFILFYSSTLAVACLLAAAEIAVRRPKQGSRLVGYGIRLAYAQIATAAFDMLENFALWQLLSGATSRIWPVVAYGCSIAKYVLVAISLLYVFIAFVFWVVDHKQPQVRREPAAG